MWCSTWCRCQPRVGGGRGEGYRRAVVTFSDKLNSTSFDNRELDAELDAELDDLWHDEIQPALTDLRCDLSNHDLIRDWIVESATDLKALLTGAASTAAGLIMGAGTIPVVPSLLGAAVTGAGLALPPTIGIAKALKERRPAKRADLFYLYELDRRL